MILVAATSIQDAKVAPWFLALPAPPGPPPAFVATTPPALVAHLPIVIEIVHDWRWTGRVRRDDFVSGDALVAIKFAQIPRSETAVWDAIVGWSLSATG